MEGADLNQGQDAGTGWFFRLGRMHEVGLLSIHAGTILTMGIVLSLLV